MYSASVEPPGRANPAGRSDCWMFVCIEFTFWFSRRVAHPERWRGRYAPRQRHRVFPSADCPGASRLANQPMQRVAEVGRQ